MLYMTSPRQATYSTQSCCYNPKLNQVTHPKPYFGQENSTKDHSCNIVESTSYNSNRLRRKDTSIDEQGLEHLSSTMLAV